MPPPRHRPKKQAPGPDWAVRPNLTLSWPAPRPPFSAGSSVAATDVQAALRGCRSRYSRVRGAPRLHPVPSRLRAEKRVPRPMCTTRSSADRSDRAVKLVMHREAAPAATSAPRRLCRTLVACCGVPPKRQALLAKRQAPVLCLVSTHQWFIPNVPFATGFPAIATAVPSISRGGTSCLLRVFRAPCRWAVPIGCRRSGSIVAFHGPHNF